MYDTNDEIGTLGQVLSSTGSGVDWVDTSSFVDNIYTADGIIPAGTRSVAMIGDLNFDSNTFFIDSSANRVGVGTNSPERKFHVVDSTFSTLLERTTAITDAGISTAIFRTTASGQMEDGFGGSVLLAGQDADNVQRLFGAIYGIRDGADNRGGLALASITNNVPAFRMHIKNNGEIGVGTDSPDSIFHIDANAANTAAILTLENNIGDFQVFNTNTTPESAVTGSIGDLAIDSVNGNLYIKESGNSTSTGWDVFVTSSSIGNVYTTDGVLTGDRSINVDNHNLVFNEADSILFSSTSGIYGSSMEILPDELIFNTNDGSNNGDFGVTPEAVYFQASNAGGALGININSANGLVFTDSLNNRGAEYFADYSANYTNRSLVDKEYVDNLQIALWDIDHDTGIQVEKTADEDWIRFNIGDSSGVAYENAMVLNNEGNLGVGELNPEEKVVINGNLHTLQTEVPELVANIGVENPNDIYIVNDYAYITTNKEFVIVSIEDKTNPNIVGNTSSGLAQPVGVYVSGKYAYIIDLANKMVIFDVSNPSKPEYIGEISGKIDEPRDIYVSGNRAFVTSYNNAMVTVFNISNPANPYTHGTAEGLIKNPEALYVSGKYIYVTDATNGEVSVFDANITRDPQLLSTITDIKNPVDIYISGQYGYVVDRDSGTLEAINIADTSAMAYIGNVNLPFSSPEDLWVSGDYAYIIGGKDGVIAIYDITDPSNMQLVNLISGYGESPSNIFINSKYAYIINNSNNQGYIFELNHTKTPNLVTGSALMADLQVEDNAQFDNDVYVWGGIGIGNDLDVQHNLSVTGRTLLGGFVGIGTNEGPLRELQIGESGDGSSAIANAWLTFSDERYKKNITPIEGSLNKILELEGVEYEWKKNNEKTIGFIAQEVGSILPEIVFEDKEGYLSIDYSKVTPVLVNAIKEQQVQINELKQQGGVSKDGEVLEDRKDLSENINFLTELSSTLTKTVIDHESRISSIESILLKGDVELNSIGANNLVESSETLKDFTSNLEVLRSGGKNVEFTLEGIFTVRELQAEIVKTSEVIITNKDAAGRATIIKGENNVEVKFEEEFKVDPIVTVNIHDVVMPHAINNISEKGFTIKIKENAEKDIKFTWQVVLVEAAE